MAKVSITKSNNTSNVNLKAFNDFDEEKAKKLANDLNASDVNQMINFGAETNSKYDALSKKIFSGAATDKAGEAGESLVELVKLVDGVNGGVQDEPSGLVKMLSSVPIIGNMLTKTMDKAETMVLSKRDIEANFQSIEKRLDDSCEILMKDNIMVNNLEEETKSYVIETNTNIKAVEIKLSEYNKLIADKIKEIDNLEEGTDDTLHTMELGKLQSIRTSLEAKKNDFDAFKTDAILELPTFDLMRSANAKLVQRINTQTTHIIPSWRKQIGKMILLERQNKTAKMVGAATDTTNQFMIAASEKMKESILRTAEEMQKDAVSYETLVIKANNLRDTIKGGIAIEQEGKKRRDEQEAMFEKLRNDTSSDIQDAVEKMQDSYKYAEDTEYTEVTEEEDEKLYKNFKNNDSESEPEPEKEA